MPDGNRADVGAVQVRAGEDHVEVARQASAQPPAAEGREDFRSGRGGAFDGDRRADRLAGEARLALELTGARFRERAGLAGRAGAPVQFALAALFGRRFLFAPVFGRDREPGNVGGLEVDGVGERQGPGARGGRTRRSAGRRRRRAALAPTDAVVGGGVPPLPQPPSTTPATSSIGIAASGRITDAILSEPVSPQASDRRLGPLDVCDPRRAHAPFSLQPRHVLLLELDRAHGVLVGELLQDRTRISRSVGLLALQVLQQQPHGAVRDLHLRGRQRDASATPYASGGSSRPAITSRARRRMSGSCASSEISSRSALRRHRHLLLVEEQVVRRYGLLARVAHRRQPTCAAGATQAHSGETVARGLARARRCARARRPPSALSSIPDDRRDDRQERREAAERDGRMGARRSRASRAARRRRRSQRRGRGRRRPSHRGARSPAITLAIAITPAYAQ